MQGAPTPTQQTQQTTDRRHNTVTHQEKLTLSVWSSPARSVSCSYLTTHRSSASATCIRIKTIIAPNSITTPPLDGRRFAHRLAILSWRWSLVSVTPSKDMWNRCSVFPFCTPQKLTSSSSYNACHTTQHIYTWCGQPSVPSDITHIRTRTHPEEGVHCFPDNSSGRADAGKRNKPHMHGPCMRCARHPRSYRYHRVRTSGELPALQKHNELGEATERCLGYQWGPNPRLISHGDSHRDSHTRSHTATNTAQHDTGQRHQLSHRHAKKGCMQKKGEWPQTRGWISATISLGAVSLMPEKWLQNRSCAAMSDHRRQDVCGHHQQTTIMYDVRMCDASLESHTTRTTCR